LLSKSKKSITAPPAADARMEREIKKTV